MVPATMYIELYKITPEMRTPQDFNQDACTCIVYRNRMQSYCFITIEFEAKVIFFKYYAKSMQVYYVHPLMIIP